MGRVSGDGEPDDEPLALVPVGDLIAVFRDRPRVLAYVVALVVCGLVVRLALVATSWLAGRGLIPGLLVAIGLVPFGLVAASVPLRAATANPDLRTASVVWRWLEAVVAGTAPHAVVIVWAAGAATLQLLSP